MSQTKQDTQTVRKHKSVPLSSGLRSKLKAFVAKYPSREVAAEQLGLNDRYILSRILRQGTCSSDTLSIIESKLGTAA